MQLAAPVQQAPVSQLGRESAPMPGTAAVRAASRRSPLRPSEVPVLARARERPHPIQSIASASRLEAEADEVARRVIAHPGDGPSLRRRPAAATIRTAPSTVPAAVHTALREPAQPLGAADRAFFEPRLGLDLSRVRIHTGERAARSAGELGARAYAVGTSVVFGANEYRPATPSGRSLLAHELAHVVQQQAMATPIIQCQPRPQMRPAPPVAPTSPIDLDAARAAWKTVKDVASGTAALKPWVTAGDQVLGLIATHADGMRDAFARGDTELANGFRSVLETDAITFRFISWHTFFYANIERVSSSVDDLTASFKADDRPFKGRKKAEAEVALLGQLVTRERQDAPVQLPYAQRRETVSTHGSGGQVVSVVLTAAARRAHQALMVAETDKVIKVEAQMEVIAHDVEAFLLDAEHEGLVQAGEAVIEFVKVRAGLKLKQEVETGTKPQEEPQPDIAPIPAVPVEDPQRRKCPFPTGLPKGEPIPITWFKPVHDYFYPKELQVRGGVVERDDPDARLPDGTWVGVSTEYWPRLGKRLELLPERRTGKQDQYKKTLADAGFDWEKRRRGGTVMVPDHVQDLFWHGPDQFGNLWPYEYSTNSSTGSSQNIQQRITYCPSDNADPRVNVRIVDERPALNGRMFKIARFAMHS